MRKSVPISGVWLRNEGYHIIVMVEKNGVWYEAIRDVYADSRDSSISHEITGNGLEALGEEKRVKWLDTEDGGKEHAD